MHRNGHDCPKLDRRRTTRGRSLASRSHLIRTVWFKSAFVADVRLPMHYLDHPTTREAIFRKNSAKGNNCRLSHGQKLINRCPNQYPIDFFTFIFRR
jgi:hypothetical protein